MDLGVPLVDYGPVDIDALRARMLSLPADFWTIDRPARKRIAEDRPGEAVYFYNPRPPKVQRLALSEAATGFISVLRHPERALFAEIDLLIDNEISRHFPACDVLRVQLAELPPGEVIAPHQDGNILALVHRLHVPVVTDPGVVFTIADQDFFLDAGRLYDLNNVAPHSVRNLSQVMRVHLLIDLLPHSVARARYFDDEDAMVVALEA